MTQRSGSPGYLWVLGVVFFALDSSQAASGSHVANVKTTGKHIFCLKKQILRGKVMFYTCFALCAPGRYSGGCFICPQVNLQSSNLVQISINSFLKDWFVWSVFFLLLLPVWSQNHTLLRAASLFLIKNLFISPLALTASRRIPSAVNRSSHNSPYGGPQGRGVALRREHTVWQLNE